MCWSSVAADWSPLNFKLFEWYTRTAILHSALQSEASHTRRSEVEQLLAQAFLALLGPLRIHFPNEAGRNMVHCPMMLSIL